MGVWSLARAPILVTTPSQLRTSGHVKRCRPSLRLEERILESLDVRLAEVHGSIAHDMTYECNYFARRFDGAKEQMLGLLGLDLMHMTVETRSSLIFDGSSLDGLTIKTHELSNSPAQLQTCIATSN